jgi:hypothetical protein
MSLLKAARSVVKTRSKVHSPKPPLISSSFGANHYFLAELDRQMGKKKIILNSSISKMVGNAGVERFKIVSVRTYRERSQEEFPIFTKITFPYYSVKSRPSGRDGGSNKRDIH